MKVLGIDIAGTEIRWVGIAGTAKRGNLLPQATNNLPLPSAGKTEFENLLKLRQLIATRLSSGEFERVGIVRADRSSTSLRVKCELMVEMAGQDVGIDCRLVSTQTISAAEKRKIPATTGTTLEEAFNGGQEILPKYLARAVLCAWCVL